MREIVELNENWFFFHGSIGTNITKSRIYNYFSRKLPSQVQMHKKWEKITVPHDWDARGPFLKNHKSGSPGGYAPCGVGWYKRELEITGQDKGKIIFLNFDGIYKRASFWLNERYIGFHYYGFGAFELDITKFIQFDQTNTLYVRVNNDIQPSCRWYSGSGIYREAWLIKKNPIYLSWGGIFAQTTLLDKKNARINVFTECCIHENNSKPITITQLIKDINGIIISTVSKEVNLDNISNSSQIITVNQDLGLDNPIRWDISNPYLYTIETILTQNSQELDRQSFKYGLRTFKFDGKGFFLNEENLKLKGACVHHDGGCVGAAVPKSIWKRRLNVWKSMGGNAIRTSHGVPASDFLDLCDELGILVINEAFDKWTNAPRIGAWGGRSYWRYWTQELSNFIRRDRNRPSVILWSLGNEISLLRPTTPKKCHITMYNLVKSLDPNRPITTVLSPQDTRRELNLVRKGKKPFLHDIVDVFCTNYSERDLSQIYTLIPNKSIIIAEAHHYYRNLGCNESDLPQSELHPNCSTRNPWYDVAKNEYCAGQFLWVGIEYLGEVRDRYPFHGRTNAPIRINGLKKPQAGFHESVWLNYPYIHLSILDESANIPRGKPQFDFPKIVRHWNFENHSQKEFDAWIFTNCEAVELLLNGKSLGEKRSIDYPYNTMTFKTEFQSGEIVAIGKNNGKEVTRSSLKTAGSPYTICLTADKLEIFADGKDCAHILAQIQDKAGNLVQLNDQYISFSIHGEAHILGIDNGDLSDFIEQGAYQRNSCKTYWGETLLIIQSTKTPGRITVAVESVGLQSDKINIISK